MYISVDKFTLIHRYINEKVTVMLYYKTDIEGVPK